MRTYHLITFGCQMNFNDSERLKTLLDRAGLKPVPDKYQADLVVMNTCGVRQSPEDRVYGLVPQIKKKNPATEVIITGCIAHRPDVQRRLQAWTPRYVPILQFPQLLDRLVSPAGKATRSRCTPNFFKIPAAPDRSFSASIPIMTGCNNYCTYCVVPFARGPETSRPTDEILKEAQSLIKKGVKEITLLGQNVNSYQPPAPKTSKTGKRTNAATPKIKDFPDLLAAVAQLPGDFWLRFITSHPKDMSDKLIQTIAQNPKITNYIHLPFQAGSDKILERMNRRYTRDHYLSLIKKIRRALPEAAITTDVIVGFPGETRADFAQSEQVMRLARFDMAYLAQYSPRPQTAAFKLKDSVPKPEKKRRKIALTRILQKTAKKNNQQYVGQIVKILIESRQPAFALGKTETFKTVRLHLPEKNGGQGKTLDKIKTGEFYPVLITKADDFGLEGIVE